MTKNEVFWAVPVDAVSEADSIQCVRVEDYERLRAALERIASPHKEWMNITEAAVIAREALAGSVHEPKPRLAYHETHEPPHCPSCDCPTEPPVSPADPI